MTNGDIQPQKIAQPTQAQLVTHDIAPGREIGYFSGTGQRAGVSTAGGTYYSVRGYSEDLLFRTPAEAQQYATSKGTPITSQVGVSDVPSDVYWQQKTAREEAAKSAYGGVRTEGALAPIGEAMPGSQLAAKTAMLESGTAQFSSEQAFREAAQQVGSLVPLQAKGVIVSPGYTSGEAQLKAMQPVTTAPKPGEWGYHGTKEQPGGIVEANITEQMQQAIYRTAFAPPSERITSYVGEQWWKGLTPTERAGALIVGGFNQPVNIGGKYLESKLFGGAPAYQTELYKYEIQGAQTVDIPFLGRQIVPKTEVVTETGIGMGSLLVTGAAFRGVTYLTGLGLKGAVRGAEFATKELEISAAARTGIFSKTAMQTASTVAGLSTQALKYGASHPEMVVGLSLTIPFAGELAASQTKGEALAKIGYLGATIPLMGVGYTGIGEVRAAMPTSREFFRFVGAKAEPLTPIIEPVTSFVGAKTPEFVKGITEPIIAKATREPTARELMTPDLRAIYGEVSPGRKIKIESAVRLMEALKEAPPEQLKPIDFTSPKYGGKIGEDLKAMIKQKPGEYVIGGSTSIGAFVPEFRPGADWDIYAKQYGDTARAVLGMSERAYPGASVKTAKPHITTIQQPTSESIIDVHRLEELTAKVGQPIETTIEGKRAQLTRGTVREPIKVEGVQYLDIREQMFRKFEGTAKFLKSETMVNPPHTLVGREKDIADFTAIVESLARSKARTAPKAETERILREIESFKLHSGLAVEEYGIPYYESVKGKPAIPFFGAIAGAKASEYYNIPIDTSGYGLPGYAPPRTKGTYTPVYSGYPAIIPGLTPSGYTPSSGTPGYPTIYEPPYTPSLGITTPSYTPPSEPSRGGGGGDTWKLRFPGWEEKKKKAKPRRKETYFRTPRPVPLREALDPAEDLKRNFARIAKAMSGTKYIKARRNKKGKR